MKLSSTISSKGQITVPLRIRERLGLSAGDRVEFVIEGDRTIIRPGREAENRFEKYRGAVGRFPGGVKGINAWIDDMRSDEEPRRK